MSPGWCQRVAAPALREQLENRPLAEPPNSLTGLPCGFPLFTSFSSGILTLKWQIDYFRDVQVPHHLAKYFISFTIIFIDVTVEGEWLLDLYCSELCGFSCLIAAPKHLQQGV